MFIPAWHNFRHPSKLASTETKSKKLSIPGQPTWRLGDGLVQNAKSKLFVMYIPQSIAKLMIRPDGENDVIVSSNCSGTCQSDLPRQFKGSSVATAIGLKIYDLWFNKTTEEGAGVYVSAAVLGYEGHGDWYKTTALTESYPYSYSSTKSGFLENQPELNMSSHMKLDLEGVPAVAGTRLSDPPSSFERRPAPGSVITGLFVRRTWPRDGACGFIYPLLGSSARFSDPEIPSMEGSLNAPRIIIHSATSP